MTSEPWAGPTGDILVLHAAGEIDVLTHSLLQAALTDAMDHARGDLADVSFCSAHGLALLNASAPTARAGVPLDGVSASSSATSAARAPRRHAPGAARLVRRPHQLRNRPLGDTQQLDDTGVIDALARRVPDAGADTLAGALIDAANHHTGGSPTDDIGVVVIHRSSDSAHDTGHAPRSVTPVASAVRGWTAASRLVGDTIRYLGTLRRYRPRRLHGPRLRPASTAHPAQGRLAMRLHPGEVEASGWRVAKLSHLVKRLRDVSPGVVGRPRVVAIDGRGGAGKSTLAERLRAIVPSSTVVHTDDIAWNHAFFDWAGLMAENILQPLHGGAAVEFRPPAWIEHDRPGVIRIPADLDVVWIEGTGIIRQELARWTDASIWLQADLDEQEQRLVTRDGDSPAQQQHIADWLAEELPLLLREQPWAKATIIAAGTTELSYEPETEIVIAPPTTPCC